MKNQELVKFQIPEGYTAKIEGDEVRISKVEFIDGDFVVEKIGDCPFIYKGTDNAGFHLFHAGLNVAIRVLIIGDDEGRFGNGSLRAATAEEKQELEDALTGKGLFWNAATKRIEKKRWRAPIGEEYFYLLDSFVVDLHIEANDKIDCGLYDSGNYFRTKEQAEKAVGVIKDALRRFFTEN